MALISKLFTSPPDAKLEHCRVNDAGHVALNANNKGPHVGKIQQALLMIAGMDRALAEVTSRQEFAKEQASQTYGQATAAAVLKYKQDRKIINASYQKTADNLVGKMTIVSLDQSVALIEAAAQARVRLLPYIGLHSIESSDPRAFATPGSRTPSTLSATAPALRLSAMHAPTTAQSLMPVTMHVAKPAPLVGNADLAPTSTGTRWSVASISYMHSVAVVGQFGFALYRFRNDETNETADYWSPQFGAGISLLDLIEFVKWLKGGAKLGGEVIKIADDVIEKVMAEAFRGGNLKDKFIGVLKAIAKAIASGVSISAPWSPYSQAEVFLPLWFGRLNEKTIGGGGASFAYSAGQLYVYGPVWYLEDSGKKMFRTRDLMRIDTHAWLDGIQLPGASVAGGPLLRL